MSESTFWQYLKPKVTGWWRRIESPISSGFPDCFTMMEGCEVWVELKNLNSWESGLGTSSIQRYWHWNYWNLGGTSFLLVRVKKEILLFEADSLCGEPGEAYWRPKALFTARVGSFDCEKMCRLMAEIARGRKCSGL